MKPHPLLTTGVLSSMCAVVGLMMCMGIPPGMDEMGDWPSLAATIVPGMNEWPDTEPTLGGHSCYSNHTQADEVNSGNVYTYKVHVGGREDVTRVVTCV